MTPEARVARRKWKCLGLGDIESKIGRIRVMLNGPNETWSIKEVVK